MFAISMIEISETRSTNCRSMPRTVMRFWKFLCWDKAGVSKPVLSQHMPHACWACWGYMGVRVWGEDFYSLLQVLRGKFMTRKQHAHDT